MEFKRVLFLKKQMTQKLGRESREWGVQDIFAMDALTLAYIGDLQCADIKQPGIGDGVRPPAEPYPF